MSGVIERQEEVEPPALIAEQVPGCRVFYVWVDGIEYHALVSRDEIAPGDGRWHVSVSAENDIPPWPVLAAVGHELRPGVPFAIGVPPRSWWINVHPNTLHLYELKDENLIDQWRSERRGHAPS